MSLFYDTPKIKDDQFESVVSENQFIITWKGSKVLVTLEEAEDKNSLKVTVSSDDDFSEEELNVLCDAVKNMLLELINSIVPSN